jgi:hypothetical protein
MSKLKTNINRIKNLMRISDKNEPEETEIDGEISEEGEAAASGGGYPTVTKWESGAARGKGNPIDSKKKWESGITRGKGNTLI